MNWNQAAILVKAMNIIDEQRTSQESYLTTEQYDLIDRLQAEVRNHGFEVRYRTDSQAKYGFSFQIASQVTSL